MEQQIEPGVATLLCHEFDVKFPNRLKEFDLERFSTDLFGYCYGFETDYENGSIRLLVDHSNKTNGIPLFSNNDIKLVMQNCIRRVSLAFGDSNDLIYCKSNPETIIENSDFLATLIHAHQLCENFVKGVFGDIKSFPDDDIIIPEILYTHVQCGMMTVRTNDSTTNYVIKHEFGRHIELDISLKTESGEEVLTTSASQWKEKLKSVGEELPLSILRLQELSKLIAIALILFEFRQGNEFMKRALELHLSDGPTDFDAMSPHHARLIQNREVGIENFLQDLREGWNPPHPLYSENAVEKRWQQVLRLNGLEYKEHLISPRAKEEFFSNLRRDLRLADEFRFNLCAKRIGESFHVHWIKIRPLMPSYLDKSPTTFTKLLKYCCNGWWQNEAEITKRIIAEFDKIGIKFEDHPMMYILGMPYGGVTLAPTITFENDIGEMAGKDINYRSIPIISLLELEKEGDKFRALYEANDLMPYIYEELGMRCQSPPGLRKNSLAIEDSTGITNKRRNGHKKKAGKKKKPSRMYKILVFLFSRL